MLFAYNLMMGYPKKNRGFNPYSFFKKKLIRKSAFDKNKKKEKARFKFNPGLALTGVQTAGPSSRACWKSILKLGNLWIFTRQFIHVLPRLAMLFQLICILPRFPSLPKFIQSFPVCPCLP